ncbi:MAG: methyltransferase family protein [Candidatus Hodarchaeota archaeon]
MVDRMIILITIGLVFIFLLNLFIYWIIFQKVKDKNKELVRLFYKIFPIIWIVTLITIPIINSSLLRAFFPENSSYFDDYWNLFALLGITFIIIGINFAKRGRKRYRIMSTDEKVSKLITSGIYRIIRHPTYSGWVIIFLGAALISDSLTSLILCPIIYFILEFHALIEEKLILIPKYGEKYEKFKKKTPYRIIPTPLNFFLIILVFIIVYMGFINVN